MSEDNIIQTHASEILDNIKKEENIIKPSNQFGIEQLRESMISFFEDHLGRIERREKLAETIENKIMEKVETDETIDFNQLRAFLKDLSGQSSNLSELLLAIFRPTPGTPSILADSIGHKVQEDSEIDILTTLNDDERNQIKEAIEIIKKLK
jgi:hypothetical protein